MFNFKREPGNFLKFYWVILDLQYCVSFTGNFLSPFLALWCVSSDFMTQPASIS